MKLENLIHWGTLRMHKFLDFKKVKPDQRQPCEYIIEVRCKGWYKPDDSSQIFIADSSEKPEAEIVKWRNWSDGKEYNLANRADEIRESTLSPDGDETFQ